MSTLPGSLIFFLLFASVSPGQGLNFSKHSNPDSIYCGHLHCLADKTITEKNISYIISLAIYDVTQPNCTKLASLSVFGPDPCLRESEINGTDVTGNISTSHGELTLGIRNHSFCLAGSFKCELLFVNANGQPDVIKKTLSPQSSGNCGALEKEVAKLRQENVDLKVQVSQLQTIVNASQDISQVTCERGMKNTTSREKILLWGKVQTLCDTQTDGGGWIVIQRRTKGDVDFYRDWEEYKKGFGTPVTDFWIGNDVIHNLTSQNYTELRVDMEYSGRPYFARYSHFDVANETSLYLLSVNVYNGTAGDSLADHNGRNFSTFDKDNDDDSGNCASISHGGWWYNRCFFSNLNGMWGAGNGTGLEWDGVILLGSVSLSEMKVRHGFKICVGVFFYDMLDNVCRFEWFTRSRNTSWIC